MGLSIITLALAKKQAIKNIDAAVADCLTSANAYTDAAISKFVSFSIELVESLPAPSEAKDHTIYFLHRSNPSGGADYYYEYILINNMWELIGSTELDLSSYWTIEQVKEYVDSKEYTLPMATETTLGGVKVNGDSIQIAEDGTISIVDSYLEDATQGMIDENFSNISNNEINNLFN